MLFPCCRHCGYERELQACVQVLEALPPLEADLHRGNRIFLILVQQGEGFIWLAHRRRLDDPTTDWQLHTACVCLVACTLELDESDLRSASDRCCNASSMCVYSVWVAMGRIVQSGQQCGH